MQKSKIEWCDMTWNPVTGCYHGCEYCYARKIANRFGKLEKGAGISLNDCGSSVFELNEKAGTPYPYKFCPTLHRYRLNEPSAVKKPQKIFVCSMADLFGEWVPDEWIETVFEACRKAPQHTYMFLTKNPQRYHRIKAQNGFTAWYGETVTNQSDLLSLEAQPQDMHRFISIEPLQEELSYVFPFMWKGFENVRRAIIGAETGTRKNKVIPERAWIDEIVNFCTGKGIKVFMKDSLVPIVGEENMIREPLPEQSFSPI